MRRRPLGWLVAALAILGPPPPARAQVELAELFGDGMVLQRGEPVPVWGSAPPGTVVAVTLAGRSDTATAGSEGGWRVELAPLPAGGPHELTVAGDGEVLRLGDVLVGDVWVCSGQSNMEWPVSRSRDAEAQIAAADDRSIRHFKVPRSWAEAPETTLAGGAWETADPDRVGGFTAVGYFFARQLRRHVDVPIGLINASWGGSRIEAWMSAESLGLDAAGVRAVLEREKDSARELLEAIRARAGELPERDPGLIDGHPVWADPSLDDSAWHSIRVPSLWEEEGWTGMDGVAWYRTEFELSEAQAAAGVRLGLGMIDDSDTTWVNGHQVGRTEMAWSEVRVYEVPAEVLVAGPNVVAVRVEDTGGGGGIYGEAAFLFAEAGQARTSLAGEWKFRLGAAKVNLEARKHEVPTQLYNRMIHPLQRFPVKGILWYQGESNAWPEDAVVYRRLFRDLIVDWRRGWASPELPFLFVQLANFLPPVEEPGDSDWAMLRESQSLALALSGTAQAVAIDAGEAEDVHPRDKQVIGRRLALAARGLVYGEEVAYSGPVYRGHRIQGGRVVVSFDHAIGGLVARGSEEGRLEEFAIAGADRRFVRAQALIDGDRVVVWSESVPEPVAVRYAWADNPERVNLYNGAGLPASPFRTDVWPPATGSTAPAEPGEEEPAEGTASPPEPEQ